jgi:superfamily I DNA/RNA helicase
VHWILSSVSRCRAQSIYSFRGAVVGNFALFRRDFEPLVVRLERNFRCTAHILGVARAVVEANEGRQGKVLQTAKTGKRVRR